MSTQTDWLPTMCRKWLAYLIEALWIALGIPATEFTELVKPPMDGNGLLHYRFTRRRKEKLVFDAEDAGMTVYVCCRYENQKGEVGQRGLAASATIPWSGIAIKALGLFPHSYHKCGNKLLCAIFLKFL